MTINQNEIDSLVDSTFRLNDCEIEILPSGVREESIFCNGNVFAVNNSFIKIEGNATDIDSNVCWKYVGYPYSQPGKLVPEDKYCKVVIRTNKKEWIIPRIMYWGSYDEICKKYEFRSNINYMYSVEPANLKGQRSKLVAIIPGNYSIPFNQFVLELDGSHSRRKYSAKSEAVDFDIIQHKNYIIIEAKSNLVDFTKERCLKFIRGISVALGKQMRPVYLSCDNSEECINFIFSSYSAKIKLPPPVPIFTGSDSCDFADFILKYYALDDDIERSINGFWDRCIKTYELNYDLFGLVICTSIEGMIKAHFSQIEYDKMFQEILKIEIGKFTASINNQRIIDFVNSAVSNAKRPKPKATLLSLVSSSNITDEDVKKWNKLRNIQAHPNAIDDFGIGSQKIIDLSYSVLSLFYNLIYVIIGYNGQFTDFSEDGWPVKRMSQPNEL